MRHTIYDKEHKLHRILYKALQLIRTVATTITIQGKAERLLLDFPEMKDITVSQGLFDQMQWDRKSAHYSKVFLISKMLLFNYRPDFTGGKDHVLALLFDMNRLWEEYVYHQLLKLNSDWVTAYQRGIDFWQPDGGDASRLRPDLVITNHSCGRVVIDTKWKVIEDQYPSGDDLQQMFAYAHYADACNVILIYPSLQKVSCHVLKVPLLGDGENKFLKGLDIAERDI